MSSTASSITKRRRSSHMSDKTIKASKARSCEACRRLKTRCETSPSDDRCHRCGILGIKCSFDGVIRNETPQIQCNEEVATNHQCKNCACQKRLLAVETALAQIQASLSPRNGPTGSKPDRLETAHSSTERTARDAPMSLIKEIRENITLHQQPSQIQDFSEDIIVNGMISESTALSLLKGFSKLSSRWLFMNTDLVGLRNKSPLLFGTCILAGLHITPSLHGSETHQALYRHVHGLLGRAHLAPASSLETIQAMLIFSMWDLRPTRDHDHGNSWLLSGTAAMKVIMNTPFEQLLQASNSSDQARARELMRTWNLICLCQLQFSVGSGRPPVISSQYFDECAKVIEFPFYNARDELVLAGVNLYRTLWELTSSNVIRKERTVWPEIEDLRKSQEHIYNLDSSEPLRFAYCCTYLILARRTLQHMNELHARETTDSRIAPDNPHTVEFITFAIHHSYQILNLFLSMSDLTTCIHPAYENLLCSYAMVTLAEFVGYLTNINEIVVLMERAISHMQHGGKAEPVSRWSLNIMRQYATGDSESETLLSTDAPSADTLAPVMSDAASKSWVDNEWSIEQEFPSLEEMFFGNVT